MWVGLGHLGTGVSGALTSFMKKHKIKCKSYASLSQPWMSWRTGAQGGHGFVGVVPYIEALPSPRE